MALTTSSIHSWLSPLWGQSRRSSYLGMSASPLTSDVSVRDSETTLRAICGHSGERQSIWCLEGSAHRLLAVGLRDLPDKFAQGMSMAP